jgi:hypothetical protein
MTASEHSTADEFGGDFIWIFFVVIFCSVFVPAGWFVGCHNDEDDEEASLYLVLM